MKQLFITEFLHFRKWAIGFAVFQFMLLYYLFSLGVPFTGRPFCLLWMTLMMFLAAGFGYLQMKLHKRPNEWLYLLHRPLSHQRIFTAVTLAGIALILTACSLPALLNVVIMDYDGFVGIELRHYLYVLYAFVPIFIGYFCGCFTALSPNRLAFLVMVLAASFMNAFQHTWIVPLSWLFLLVALYLAWTAFRPDLDSSPRRIGQLLAAELPIQYATLWGIALIMLIFVQISRGAFSSQPQPASAPQGTEAAVVNGGNAGPQATSLASLDVVDDAIKVNIRDALEKSNHPDAKFLMQQVKLAEHTQMVKPPDFFSHPDKNQFPMYDNTISIMDNDRNVRWNFLHGEMLFEGRDMESKNRIGWLGPEGFSMDNKPDRRFTRIPWVTNNLFVMTEQNIYQVDLEELSISKRFTLGGDDRFNDSLGTGEKYTTLLSDNKLFIFNSREFHDIDRPLEPLVSMPYPGKDLPGNRFTSLLELIDGFLITTKAGWAKNSFDPWTDFPDYRGSYLLLYRVAPGREPELITDYRGENDVSDFTAFQAFVASPGIRLLTDLLWGTVMKKDIEDTLPLFYVTFPGYIWMLAVLVCAFCGAAVAWLLRKSGLPKSVRLFWIILVTLTGFAGLLSFLVGSYWRRSEQMRIGLPAPVAPEGS